MNKADLPDGLTQDSSLPRPVPDPARPCLAHPRLTREEEGASRQMALGLRLDLKRDDAFLARQFIPGASNAAARAWLARPRWPEERLWLWGAPGTGKTHLLRLWARRMGAPRLEASQIGLDGQGGLLCAGKPLAEPQALVLDHLDELRDETALLHLLNRAHGAGKRVLLAGRQPPGRSAFTLPDLASRLRATATAVVEEPEDSLRATLLLSLLAARQLIVAQPVTDWLWRHLPRTGEALVCAVERLDALALERGAPITRELAREALSDWLEPDRPAS